MDKITSQAESKIVRILCSTIVVSYTHQYQNKQKESALFTFLIQQLDGPSENEASFHLFNSALVDRTQLSVNCRSYYSMGLW